MKRSTKSVLSERRRQVADYALKGWTQAAIARHMNLSPAKVSRDLAAMRDSWREFSLFNFEQARLEQLQKIDLVETEAWAAWHRSQEPVRSASITNGKAGEQNRTSLKHQFGDHRFLREVSRCIGERTALIGLKAPDPPAPQPPERPEDYRPMGSAYEFSLYLALRGRFGDPPYRNIDLRPGELERIIERNKTDPFGFARDMYLERLKAATTSNDYTSGGQAETTGEMSASES